MLCPSSIHWAVTFVLTTVLLQYTDTRCILFNRLQFKRDPPPPLLCESKIPFLAERTDLVALLDEFASRFFDELDYVKECANGVAIREDMKHIQQVKARAGGGA